MNTETRSRPETAASATLGAIAVSGADAETFLQAQISNDVAALGPDDSRLAAWCDAKGRVQAIVRVLRRGDDLLLLLPRALVAPTLKRLHLFVLRARVELRDAGDELAVRGVIGGPAGEPPLQDPRPGAVLHDGERQYLALPGPEPRCLVIAPPSAAPEAVDDETWRRADILAGLPQVYPETQGRFVPQMLNLHWLGGIDFHKGCYPGQEVVARLEYRGKLTRRMFRGTLDAEETPAPGTPVTDTEDKVQGEVVEAAPRPKGQDLLAVLKIAQRSRAPTGGEAGDGALRIGGAELTLAPLPYPTDDKKGSDPLTSTDDERKGSDPLT